MLLILNLKTKLYHKGNLGIILLIHIHKLKPYSIVISEKHI